MCTIPILPLENMPSPMHSTLLKSTVLTVDFYGADFMYSATAFAFFFAAEIKFKIIKIRRSLKEHIC